MRSDLEIYQTWWEERFAELVKFKKIHGHCNVPMLCPENPKLGNWVLVQRQNRKNGKLSTSRIRRLEEIGFQWRLRSWPTWGKMFSELVKFRKRYGHCDVPVNWAENPRLGNWVVSQRRKRYERNPIVNEHIRLLDEIGFRWRINSTWEERFAELVRFKKDHGHIYLTPGNCPEKPTFANWVTMQRHRYRNGLLDNDRSKRLEELGFV